MGEYLRRLTGSALGIVALIVMSPLLIAMVVLMIPIMILASIGKCFLACCGVESDFDRPNPNKSAVDVTLADLLSEHQGEEMKGKLTTEQWKSLKHDLLNSDVKLSDDSVVMLQRELKQAAKELKGHRAVSAPASASVKPSHAGHHHAAKSTSSKRLFSHKNDHDTSHRQDLHAHQTRSHGLARRAS